VSGVKADPPAIFYSTTPAVLVNIDGEPIWSPIKDNDLKFAVNTNWDLFQLESSKTFYLRHEQSWLKASDVKGPWSPAGTLPASFSKLPPDDNWKDVKAALPGKAVTPGRGRPCSSARRPPRCCCSEASPATCWWPARPISSGSRTRKAICFAWAGPVRCITSSPAGGSRRRISPARGPLPRRRCPRRSGRFRSSIRVRVCSPRSRERPQAAEAVLLAQVPQNARVKKKELKAPEVTYQGAPKFDPIPQTSVSQAVNTDKQIIKVGDLYYMCFQGVWFVAKAPEGPWEVTGTVPKEIYEIPASSSAHNVTYVTVEDDDDDWATFAAVAGYTGVMIGWGCAVWGSGYYYPPYWGYGGYYPYYYPFYPTYGYGAWYNPWTGAYGRSAVAYGPTEARASARATTRGRAPTREARPPGDRTAREATPRHTIRAPGHTRRRARGRTSTAAGAAPPCSAATIGRRPHASRTTARATQRAYAGERWRRDGPAEGAEGSGGVARTGSGDIYAGRDGNVYRQQDGNWQKYENGSWGDAEKPANRPSTTDRSSSTTRATERGSGSDTVSQLDRDRAARTDGATRTRDAGTYRGSGSSGTGSYRPSGGGMRGGGMRGGGRRR
jgi:hypothetical protein